MFHIQEPDRRTRRFQRSNLLSRWYAAHHSKRQLSRRPASIHVEPIGTLAHFVLWLVYWKGIAEFSGMLDQSPVVGANQTGRFTIRRGARRGDELYFHLERRRAGCPILAQQGWDSTTSSLPLFHRINPHEPGWRILKSLSNSRMRGHARQSNTGRVNYARACHLSQASRSPHEQAFVLGVTKWS